MIDVLSNDEDLNGDPIAITAFSSPVNGTVSLVSVQLVYTPNPGFLGTDASTYTVSTGAESANATVTVLVTGEDFRLFLPLIRR